jgi:hypothetical protein
MHIHEARILYEARIVYEACIVYVARMYVCCLYTYKRGDESSFSFFCARMPSLLHGVAASSLVNVSQT